MTISTKIKNIFYIVVWLISFPVRLLRLLLPIRKYVDWRKEKSDIIERANWLCDRVIVAPNELRKQMPKMLGKHYGCEWAIYSCSMLVAALSNISRLYPEERGQNIEHVDKLIGIILSPEIRWYDTAAWKEDVMKNMKGNKSHMTYLSILAWAISNYKMMGGGAKYDDIFHASCEALHQRMLQSSDLNLPSFPNGIVFLPDMLVTIVALHNYSKIYGGIYGDIVQKWMAKAKNEWLHEDSGLLIALYGKGRRRNIRGSYSALSCYYLSLIDAEFAKEQYMTMKSTLLVFRPFCAVREYHKRSPRFYFNPDAGPILFGLSPSGTAFAIGCATYFEDWELRRRLLTIAEIAGCTIRGCKRRHYILGEFALVGEAAVLAMRTNIKTD